jgi:hypothetical protein
MLRTGVLATPMLAAAAAVAVAACGGSTSNNSTSNNSTSAHPSSASPALTLGQEFPAMRAAVQAATSVAFSGSVLVNGKLESMDVIMTKSGSLSGSVTEGGVKFTILVTGGKPYIKLNKAFLQLAHIPASACATACGKYLELPSSQAKSLTSGLSMSTLANQAFGTPPTPAQASVRLVPSQYGGRPVWFGRYRSYTVDIARTGKPYLLAMTAKNGQVLRFSGWDTASVPGPPPASELVTPGQL